MSESRFAISERDLGLTSDNQIFYEAGPISVQARGWSKTITISTTTPWKDLLPDATQAAKDAWDLTDDQIISQTDTSITFTYTLDNISKYIELSIIFI